MSEIFDFGRNCITLGLLVKVWYIADKIRCNWVAADLYFYLGFNAACSSSHTDRFIKNPNDSFFLSWQTRLERSSVHKLLLTYLLTSDRQASRLVALLHAEHRPKYEGLKSDSTARNRICIGRPSGRLQSDSSVVVVSDGELRAMWATNRSYIIWKYPTVHDVANFANNWRRVGCVPVR